MFDVIVLADRFGFLLLKNAVGAVLSKKVTVENVLKFFPPAESYSIVCLKEKCLDLIEKDPVALLSSEEFLSFNPALIKMILSRDTFDVLEIRIFECLLRVIKTQKLEDSNAKELLQSCIRLTCIEIKDIFGLVEPTGYFSEAVLLQSVRAQARHDLNHIQGRGAKGRWAVFDVYVVTECCMGNVYELCRGKIFNSRGFFRQGHWGHFAPAEIDIAPHVIGPMILIHQAEQCKMKKGTTNKQKAKYEANKI